LRVKKNSLKITHTAHLSVYRNCTSKCTHVQLWYVLHSQVLWI